MDWKERKTEYSRKLRDPRWQKFRLEVMQRDEFTCRHCFDTESTLNVHHRWYVHDRAPWEYPLDSLITLCEYCHQAETERLPEAERYLVHVLKTIGAMSSSFESLVQPFHGPVISGPDDTWDVIAFGIGEILHACHHGDEAWDALRDRYYVELRERLRERGEGEQA